MQVNRIPFNSDNIRQIFGRYKTKSLAKKTGASQRKDRKFSVIDIIISYWQLLSVGEFSYDKWATQISILTNKSISGQAVWKRIRPEMIELMKQLLKKSFKQKYDTLIDSALFQFFPNVYIQDATHFRLPRSLSSIFPGSYSKFGKNATAKIQAVFNIRRGVFSGFELASFRDNDQKDSNRITKSLKEKDLVIRDLGYFVLKVFSNIAKQKAFFLSRLRFGVIVFDNETLKPLDLQKLLKKKKGIVDIQVKLGKKEKLNCRLVAVPVPQDVANKRKRKAKKDRNKQANHSKKYLNLLGYTIYITNVSEDLWSVEQIEKAYRSRWYIEILFKGWKSNLNMKITIPEKYINQQRVEFFFYASLLMVNLLVIPIFFRAQKCGIKKKQYISILKTCAFISQSIGLFINSIKWDYLIDHIQYSCMYESRNDRINSIAHLVDFTP
jgi:hypothetical protein